MSEITKEKMLEWLEMECVNCNCAPRESEVCREQEDIDQCLSTVAALEALIESSSPSGSIGKAEGEKASGGGVVFHAWKDGKWLGVVADPALSDRIFIGHIQSHLQEGEKVVCKICGRTAEEITGQAAPSPAPLPAEVEEAMDIIGFCRSNYVSPAEWDAALAVIRAALSAPPVSVTREWVEALKFQMDMGYGWEVKKMLREKGIVVGEKP
jgi:hypothetical protein